MATKAPSFAGYRALSRKRGSSGLPGEMMMSPRLTPTWNTIRVVFRGRDVAFGHPTLHGDRAGDRFNDTRKFNEDSVSGRLDDATFAISSVRIDQLTAVRLEP